MITPRMTGAIHRIVKKVAYCDNGSLVKKLGTGTYDKDNHEIVGEISVSIPCSFTDINSNKRLEIWRDYADIQEVNAEVRFEGGSPNKGDTFILNKRFGFTSFNSQRYEIVGIQDRAGFGWLCALKAIKV